MERIQSEEAANVQAPRSGWGLGALLKDASSMPNGICTNDPLVSKPSSYRLNYFKKKGMINMGVVMAEGGRDAMGLLPLMIGLSEFCNGLWCRGR
ncbi:hypothetical protein NQZ68_014335 [Dissostichus eleginoides]|nr:hypothetical protein NQZ68_014335 [Dissostichus eleginoides]